MNTTDANDNGFVDLNVEQGTSSKWSATADRHPDVAATMRSGGDQNLISVSITSLDAEQLVAHQEGQNLLQSRLTHSLATIFQELLGTELYVHWLPPFPRHRSNQPSLLCPTAQRRHKDNQLPPTCQLCVRHNWLAQVLTSDKGIKFQGHCGASNFCVLYQADPTLPPCAVLVLQTKARRAHREQVEAQNVPVSPTAVAEDALDKAIALLKLQIDELDSIVNERKTQRELKRLRHRMSILEAESGTQQKGADPVPENCSKAPINNRAQQIAHAMNQYVQQHYKRPLSLKEVAVALNMNASYLSHLFATVYGVPFHQYVEEIRLARAKELLREVDCRVCEVACAVGYSSPDQFRHVFKARIGVTPSEWKHQQGII